MASLEPTLARRLSRALAASGAAAGNSAPQAQTRFRRALETHLNDGKSRADNICGRVCMVPALAGPA